MGVSSTIRCWSNYVAMDILSQEEIRQIGQEILERFIIPSYTEKNHNASGELLNSFRVRAEEGKAIISALDYAQYLIIGRRPNKDQSEEAIRNWVKWYAPNVFSPWMATKGIDGSPYPIAYKIAREGTKQHREPSEDFMKILDSPNVTEYIRTRVGNAIIANVQNTLRNELMKLRHGN